jgi:phosphopantothenoylcysteine decarboxylase/phosphopantothenate--cysteine ligase
MTEKTEKRRIVLGVTGSIAAYKAAELSRLFVTRGYEVKVILTQSAQQFITATTMQAVSGNPVSTDFWDSTESNGIGHIQLADWADALVIAPATADFIAKLAYGFADSPLLAVALATKAPLLIAPAMNVNMYTNPRTQENLASLRAQGVNIVDPEEGALACGWNGTGRLAAPEEIFAHTRKILSPQDLAGKKVLITTGPTREALDPVRFLSNRSSGKMGVALANEAFRRGAKVQLIHGPVPVQVPSPVYCQPVVSAEEMHAAVMAACSDPAQVPDVVIMAAAVADFKAKEIKSQKIKKAGSALSFELTHNPDILSAVGALKGKSNSPLLVGFAVETGDLDALLSEARSKLERKNADLIVGNFAHEAFDLDTNRVWLVDRLGRQEEVATSQKSRVANAVLDAIVSLS